LNADTLRPDSRAELAQDLSIALLLILDRLSPLERAAFLLHDVFDFHSLKWLRSQKLFGVSDAASRG
jgi:DNA-directed RNA polymerase specialized sigma24 family protein